MHEHLGLAIVFLVLAVASGARDAQSSPGAVATGVAAQVATQR